MRTLTLRSSVHLLVLDLLPLLLAPLACDSASTTTVPCRGSLGCTEVFYYNLVVGAASGSPIMLDPNRASDTASRTVTSLLFDGLVTLDQQLRVEEWGAQQVDISADGLNYTFHLRPFQRFADDTPATAEDYAYSLNRTLNPCVASPNAHLLFPIEDAAIFASETCVNGQIGLNSAAGQIGSVITTLLGTSIRTPDDSTVVVGLARPDGGFLAALASAGAGALDPAVVGPDQASAQWTTALGQATTGRGTSGMFYVDRVAFGASSPDYGIPDNAGHIYIVANPHWWGLKQGKVPNLREIDFQLISSASTAYDAYQAGQFDNGIPTPELIKQAVTQPDIHAVNALSTTSLSFNAAHAPFDSGDARQAFCLAINRDALFDSTTKLLSLPEWNLVPQGMPGFQAAITGPDGVTNIDGDTGRARAHWRAFGAVAGRTPPSITYFYDSGDALARQQAQTLSAAWEQVLGVHVALNGEDHAAWQADIAAGRYGIAPITTTPAYPDPESVLSAVYLPDTSAYVADIPGADALMRRADASTDQAARLGLYQQAERLLVSHVASCPLYQRVSYYQVRADVHNWLVAANGLTPLDAWLTTYAHYFKQG